MRHKETKELKRESPIIKSKIKTKSKKANPFHEIKLNKLKTFVNYLNMKAIKNIYFILII